MKFQSETNDDNSSTGKNSKSFFDELLERREQRIKEWSGYIQFLENYGSCENDPGVPLSEISSTEFLEEVATLKHQLRNASYYKRVKKKAIACTINTIKMGKRRFKRRRLGIKTSTSINKNIVPKKIKRKGLGNKSGLKQGSRTLRSGVYVYPVENSVLDVVETGDGNADQNQCNDSVSAKETLSDAAVCGGIDEEAQKPSEENGEKREGREEQQNEEDIGELPSSDDASRTNENSSRREPEDLVVDVQSVGLPSDLRNADQVTPEKEFDFYEFAKETNVPAYFEARAKSATFAYLRRRRSMKNMPPLSQSRLFSSSYH